MEVVVDATDLTAELRALTERGQNLEDVNANLAQILHVMVEDKFENQGPGWPPLSDVTLRRRRASKTPHMLQDTGDMVNSLQPGSGADYAEVFTNKEYARYHLEGDGVPKRDFFDIDIEKALETLALVMTEAVAKDMI